MPIHDERNHITDAAPGELQAAMMANRAHREKDLKLLLIEGQWFTYRAFITFPKGQYDNRNPTRTFYGNEHRCTYRQCLYGKVPYILLRKLQGYTGLIDMIEQTMKGKYLSASIYAKCPQTKSFDILHRQYYKGGLKECNDPFITEEDVKTLWYSTKDGRLVLHETDPAKEDFKTQLNML